MNMNTAKTAIFSALLVLGVFITMPGKAYAVDFNPLNPLDPFCLFSCNHKPQNVNNSINNSYNNNSNSFNSVTQTNGGNGTVGTAGSGLYTYTVPTPTPATNNNYNYNYNTTAPSAPYYNYTQPVYVPSQPVYVPSNPVYYPTYYSSPLSVYCSANTTYTNTGSYVTWTAYPSGGYNNNYTYNTYTYSWSGTENLYGTASSISAYYNYPGVKNAWVSVYSNGESATAQCSNSVTVGNTYYTTYNQYPTYTYPTYGNYNSGIQVACAADTTSTRIGVPVTWVAEAALNGSANGNFTYSWSGNGGLYGSNSTAIANYSTAGEKSATVTVTSPNGQSASAACRNTVTVKSAVAYAKPVAKAPQVQYVPVPAPQVANPTLTLGNVPWGWVGILVILILMGIIFYLLFNKKKLT
jgi:hypothetical protein